MTRATRAVVLAAGRGTRMRAGAVGAQSLEPEQAVAADRGLKMLVPFAGRAFIEYLLDDLGAAGTHDVCIVIGPGTADVRTQLTRVESTVRLAFAAQSVPLGTADALLAAEAFVQDEPFLVVNADNLYPRADLARLAALDGPGLIGYVRAGLVRGGIPETRIRGFALLLTDGTGALRDVVEKPDARTADRLHDAPVSMTCWRFDARIFDACRAIQPSARGELELPDAVRHLIRNGVRFAVLPSADAVLDLSTRADVPVVAAALAERTR